MKFYSILKSAIKSILNNKLRSALTMLGLIIGIASVIILVGIGTGATSDVTEQVQSLGTDILTVTVSSSDTSFDYDELDEIKELGNITSIAPYKNLSVSTVTRESNSASQSTIMAVDDNYLTVTNTTLAKGRTLSIIDIENKSKVCILGSEIATELFNLSEPVGETINLDGDSWTVIGLLEEQGTSMGNNIDNMILIPITSSKHLGEDTNIQSFYVKVENEDNIDMTINTLKNYIRQKLSISSEYYSVTSQDSVLETMESVTSTLSLLLGGIASISLIVGGIGVMNVMLVSVTERTKEIGIRKSLGAKRRDILLQFLVESLALSVLGGIIGVVLGLGIGNLAESFDFTFNPSSNIVLISFLSSAGIGLIFGIFPAYRAANLNPIDALRTE